MAYLPKEFVGKALMSIWILLCATVLSYLAIGRNAPGISDSASGLMLLLSFPSSLIALQVSIPVLYAPYNPFWTYVPFWLTASVLGYAQWFIAVPWIWKNYVASHRAKHYIIGIVSIAAALHLLVVWASVISFPRWKEWHEAGAGLTVDLKSEREISERLGSRARLLGCVEGECTVEPRGLPKLSLQHLMNQLPGSRIYTLRVEYGPKYEPLGWRGGSYSD
jgi:hypothetical protein